MIKICTRCSEVHDLATEPCSAADNPGSAGRGSHVVSLDPMLGRVIGARYRIVSRIGSGGMSVVYLGRHDVIDRPVAVKILRRDLATDLTQRNRFLREARAVNRINHINVAEITDFGETEDGLVYLVMEYVAGQSLFEAIGRGPFESARALDIVEQIAAALSKAHQTGVIHRDLKPENLLLTTAADGRELVKVLDFGIAKLLDAPGLTGSQQIFGTPGYIAPEYIESTIIDGRADLYSLGVILYELVTAALPFDYSYPGDLLVKHVMEPPISPRVRRPELEVPVEELILRCLEKRPERRFQDADDLLVALRATRERLGGDLSWGGLSSTTTSTVGYVDVPRWRRRFDAIRAALDEIELVEAAPVTLAQSMAWCSARVDDLERWGEQLAGLRVAFEAAQALGDPGAEAAGRSYREGAYRLEVAAAALREPLAEAERFVHERWDERVAAQTEVDLWRPNIVMPPASNY